MKAQCFHCHGEAGETKGELDLRLRHLIMKGGESGEVVVPGKKSESYLFEQISEGEMPPGDHKLKKEEIEIIGKWIDAGAIAIRKEPDTLGKEPYYTYEETSFWSFQEIKNPQVPKVKNQSLVKTPIDAFLLRKLDEINETFSEEADRPILIRRIKYDLLGLPPTAEEVDQFVKDKSPDAYEIMVDRFLESPHYGENWGRHWLDVAGYSDSDGMSNADPVRKFSYKFRDYVIKSLNNNKPFSEFIREQIAGDELVKPPYKEMNPEQIEKLVATGFLRMAPDGTGDGSVEQKLAKNKVVTETIKIVSTSLMGLTVGCAECHDHRYDPISHVDYHRMRAIFEPAFDWKNWRKPRARLISLYTAEDKKAAAKVEKEAKALEAKRNEIANKYIQITLNDQLLLIPEKDRDPVRTAYNTTGKKRTKEQKAILNKYPKIRGISSGSLYLFDRARNQSIGQLNNKRAILLKKTISDVKNEFLLAVSQSQRTFLKSIMKIKETKRTAEQKKILEAYPGVLVTEKTLSSFKPEAALQIEEYSKKAQKLKDDSGSKLIKKLSADSGEYRKKKPEEQFIRALTEVPGKVPVTYLFNRGDFNQPKDKVQVGHFSIMNTLYANKLPEIPENNKNISSTGRRLAFADFLVSDSNPLTARVLTNWVWLHHFGQGIVNTPGDFGFLGGRPTHPELLDWLAFQFRSNKWNLKDLHRIILNSRAYRQKSNRRKSINEIDPDNHLLGRMSSRRLSAEGIRDSVLAVSGKLNTEMYGKPVPVKKDDVGQIVVGIDNRDTAGRRKKDIQMTGEQHRRSIYILARRSEPLAILEMFDAPAMEPNCQKRNSSTVAPQALMLMNSKFITQYMEGFTDRVLKEAGNKTEAQIVLAWKLAYGSEPSPSDLKNANSFVLEQTELFKKSLPKKSKKPAQYYAVATLCQALLSSNAFLYID